MKISVLKTLHATMADFESTDKDRITSAKVTSVKKNAF